MGEWLLSRRDRLIVARHEVPGSDAERTPVPEGRSKSLSVPQIFVFETEPRHEQATARRMFLPLQKRQGLLLKSLPPMRSVQSSRWDEAIFSLFQALRAWLRSCCPSGTKPFAHRSASQLS